jgi:hypothetical protein
MRKLRLTALALLYVAMFAILYLDLKVWRPG